MEDMNRDELARQARGDGDFGPDREQGEGVVDRARDALHLGGDARDSDRDEGAGRPEFSSREDSGDPNQAAPYTASSYTRSGGGDMEDYREHQQRERSGLNRAEGNDESEPEGGPIDPF